MADIDDPLNKKLQEYHKAITEEFELSNSNGDLDKLEGVDLAERAREVLVKRTPGAAATLQYLSEHAESESIRFHASKYILDNALGKTGFANPEDPIEALVKKLTKDKAGSEAKS